MSTKLDKILAQYEENTKKKETTKKKFEFSFDNYFAIHLPDNVEEATRRIRILPHPDPDLTPFQEIYVHETKVDGKKQKFICRAHHMDEPCPFCEAKEVLLSDGSETNRKTAFIKYTARRFYVVKLIDRDNEEHGPKFWRIKHNHNGQGHYDMILSLMKARGVDISDPEAGMDLLITIGRDPKGGWPVIKSVLDEGKSKLSDDEDNTSKWLSDTRTWEDVYSVKPYEYLAIIVKGQVPVYDKETKGWTSKEALESKESNDLEEELTIGGDNDAATNKDTASLINLSTSDTGEETDDLPF